MNPKKMFRAKTPRAQRTTLNGFFAPFFGSFLRLCVIFSCLFVTAEAQDTPTSPASTRDLKPRPAEMAPRAAKSLLLAIAAAGERYVAVGDRGTILLSTDGEKWEQVASPVHATLTAVAFADPQNGWVAGHDAAILHTSDGGKSWKLQNFQPELNKPVLALYAADAQRAWALGAYGLFLATTDAGATWTQIEAPALLDEGPHLNSMIRLGDGELFIAGETGLLAVSTNGKAWKRLTLPYEGSLFGALPRGSKGALVFGLRGNVLVTDDVHSNQWKHVDTQTVQSMFGGAYLPGGDAALVGADGEILVIGPSGAVRKSNAPQDGTLSGVLPHNGNLLVVGETGATRVKVVAP
jgi:photosystem II stability/assembly factor-like uncharacterized protein